MKIIMGLYSLIKSRGKIVNRVFLILMIVFDIYMAGLIYGPIRVANTAEALEKKISALTNQNTSPSSTPSDVVQDAESETSIDDPRASVKPSNSPLASSASSSSPAPSPNPDSNSQASSTPTPTPSTTPTTPPTTTATPPTTTATPTPTPTPSPTPTPTLAPTPTPTQPRTSSVYIKAFKYVNNQQLIAEQFPVKVINSSTNEVLFTGETYHSGTSPVWQIAENTPITVFLYPTSGTQGCGDSWSITIGTLGTMESHNLSIQGERTPCLRQ